MAYTDDLLPAKHDDNIDGNDNRNASASANGSSNPAGNASETGRSASGSGPVSDGSRTDERSHIEFSERNGDVPLLSVDDGGRKKNRQRRARRSGTGDDSGRNQGSGSGNGPAVGTKTAENQAEPVPSPSPRPVKISGLKGSDNKSTTADVAISEKFVTEIWGILFQGCSVLFRDPNWKVDEDDASDLATRTIALLKTMDAKNAAKLEKKIAKYAPSLSLLMALTALVGPRLAHTRNLRRGNFPKESGSHRANTATPTSSAPNSGAPMAESTSGNGDGQPAKFDITPIRRGHWGEVFGRDDT